MRHGIVGVDDVELALPRDMDDAAGERQHVLRLAEQRVGRRVDAVKRQSRLVLANTGTAVPS